MADYYYQGCLVQEEHDPATGVITFVADVPPGSFSSRQAAEGAIQHALDAENDSGDEPVVPRC